ncbi:MAG TPA: class II fructose-bisphosphate aldolase, partial [Arthrobacter sp.]|nr:class II fructose-bisphosphate aldolase [Arthrobacter sp.]
LEEQLPVYRADGENLQGLLAQWNAAAKDFGASTLAILSR